MKIIYKAEDGTEFDNENQCLAHEASGVTAAEMAKALKAKNDFAFMVLCASKNNMAMYNLLRDRS